MRGRRRAPRARRGRPWGRRWSRAPRCRSARRARGGDSRAGRDARRSRRTWHPQSRRRWLDLEVEERGELVREPVARRGAGEQVPMPREDAPHLAGVDAVAAAHAETGEVDALGVEQSRHVVVVRDEQLGRIGERRVVEQQARCDVPVRGDDRQVRDGSAYRSRATSRVAGSAGRRRSGSRCSFDDTPSMTPSCGPFVNRLPNVPRARQRVRRLSQAEARPVEPRTTSSVEEHRLSAQPAPRRGSDRRGRAAAVRILRPPPRAAHAPW